MKMHKIYSVGITGDLNLYIEGTRPGKGIRNRIAMLWAVLRGKPVGATVHVEDCTIGERLSAVYGNTFSSDAGVDIKL